MSEVYNILIFLFLGTGAIYIASKLTEKRKKIINNGIEVEGIIFGFEASPDSNMNASYPVLRFVTKEGLWITEAADYSSIPFLLKKGQTVKIVYNPDNPKEFIYKTSVDYSKIYYLFFAVGIACLVGGVWFAYKYLTK